MTISVRCRYNQGLTKRPLSARPDCPCLRPPGIASVAV